MHNARRDNLEGFWFQSAPAGECVFRAIPDTVPL